jgi:hypothetical protein
MSRRAGSCRRATPDPTARPRSTDDRQDPQDERTATAVGIVASLAAWAAQPALPYDGRSPDARRRVPVARRDESGLARSRLARSLQLGRLRDWRRVTFGLMLLLVRFAASASAACQKRRGGPARPLRNRRRRRSRRRVSQLRDFVGSPFSSFGLSLWCSSRLQRPAVPGPPPSKHPESAAVVGCREMGRTGYYANGPPEFSPAPTAI